MVVRKSLGPVVLLCLAALAAPLSSPSSARGQRSHLVKDGQTLAAIARHYQVPIGSIVAANGMGKNAMLRAGQTLRIPDPGVIYVQAGHNLARIARAHDVSVEQLAKVNGIRPTDTLRVGQRLVLPGFEAARARATAARRWGNPKHPGVGSFHRIWSDERSRMRLIDPRGRVRPQARKQLGHLLRAKNSKRLKPPHPRLVRMLALISDHFGGRTIDIISGYRPPGGNTKRSSRHVHGAAIDFRIQGVPLEALRDYCRKFSNVGVGFYPRSRFVHLDVRKTSAFWVDWSRPGEPPLLRQPSRIDRHDHASDQAEHEEGSAPEGSDSETAHGRSPSASPAADAES